MQDLIFQLSNSPMSVALATSPWVVPTMQIIHIVAIAIVFTSVLMVDLRVLGFSGRSQTVRQTVERFAPWIWGALILLALTGLVMIVAEPIRQLLAISFWLKMAMLAIAIAVALVFLNSLKRNEAYWEGAAPGGGRTKLLGVLTLLVWCAVIFLGRYIAYDPQVWGSASPLS